MLGRGCQPPLPGAQVMDCQPNCLGCKHNAASSADAESTAAAPRTGRGTARREVGQRGIGLRRAARWHDLKGAAAGRQLDTASHRARQATAAVPRTGHKTAQRGARGRTPPEQELVGGRLAKPNVWASRPPRRTRGGRLAGHWLRKKPPAERHSWRHSSRTIGSRGRNPRSVYSRSVLTASWPAKGESAQPRNPSDC